MEKWRKCAWVLGILFILLFISVILFVEFGYAPYIVQLPCGHVFNNYPICLSNGHHLERECRMMKSL
jgi:hypothetical protein